MSDDRPVGGTRTTLGPQASSQRRSPPIYGFGTSTREHRERVFISQEHAALSTGGGFERSPGPAKYTQLAAIGPQVDGARESAPLWSFGTDPRFREGKEGDSPPHYDPEAGIGIQFNSRKTTLPIYGFGTSTRDDQEKVFVSQEHNAVYYGRDGPGPIYMSEPAVGRQTLSFGPTGYARKVKNPSQPTWIFGKAERMPSSKSTDSMPGPGQYTIAVAVGTQASSTKKTKPAYGFGSGTREHAAKVFISHEHEKVSGGGKDVPGPGAYPSQNMTGSRIASSRQATGAAWGFGSSKRFSGPASSWVPGPGQYVI